MNYDDFFTYILMNLNFHKLFLKKLNQKKKRILRNHHMTTLVQRNKKTRLLLFIYLFIHFFWFLFILPGYQRRSIEQACFFLFCCYACLFRFGILCLKFLFQFFMFLEYAILVLFFNFSLEKLVSISILNFKIVKLTY